MPNSQYHNDFMLTIKKMPNSPPHKCIKNKDKDAKLNISQRCQTNHLTWIKKINISQRCQTHHITKMLNLPYQQDAKLTISKRCHTHNVEI